MMTVSVRKEMSVFLERQKVRKRRDWMGKLKLLERALVSAAIVFMGLLCLYGLYQMVFMGRTFAVKKIVAEGSWKNLTPQGLAELSGVKEGDNLFWVNVAQVRRRLGANPWVKSAAVKRRLPGTLWMFVEEYKPAALALVDETLYYLDDDGKPFKELGPQEDKDFPIITGITGGLSQSLSIEDSERLKTALYLFKTFHDSSFGGEHDAAEIHFDPITGYSIVLNEEPTQILFGQTALDERVGQLDEMIAGIKARNGRIQYMIVNEPDRIIVRYNDSQGRKIARSSG